MTITKKISRAIRVNLWPYMLHSTKRILSKYTCKGKLELNLHRLMKVILLSSPNLSISSNNVWFQNHPPGNSSLASYFPLKILIFETPPPMTFLGLCMGIFWNRTIQNNIQLEQMLSFLLGFSCEVIREQKTEESLQYAFIEFENVCTPTCRLQAVPHFSQGKSSGRACARKSPQGDVATRK